MWHSNRNLTLIGGGLSLIAVIFLVAFVVNFWRAPLSDRSTDWGVFGDYIGGALGTVFSFGAFVGVLFTLRHQQTQHEDKNKQYKLDEWRDFLTISTSALDAVLYKKVIAVDSIVDKVETVYSQLIEKTKRIRGIAKAPMGQAFPAQVFDTLKRDVLDKFDVEIDRIQREFSFVILCLREYQEKGGNKLVITYYSTRFIEVAIFLTELRIMGYSLVIDQQLIKDFFDIAAETTRQAPAGVNIIPR